MIKPQTDKMLHKNQLLGAFQPDVRSRILTHMRPVSLKLGTVVCEAGGHLEHAYFPEGSVLSLLTVLQNGSTIECANIGREGAFGLFSAMYSRVSFNQCVVQLEGQPCDPSFKKASTSEACLSAIRRRCCRKSCRPSRATPSIR